MINGRGRWRRLPGPRTSVQIFNDQEIATACLLTLKQAGREYAWSAMERGYYPLELAPQSALGKIGGMYQTVQTDSLFRTHHGIDLA